MSHGEEKTSAFIQWKNTDLCMDFYCDCGAHGHFDGYFAYAVKCAHCGQVWIMPSDVSPEKATANDYWVDNPQPLEPDEDFSDEVTGSDGITRMIPRPVEKTNG